MPGRNRCNVDLNDVRHCGACEHACSSNERCVDQTCQGCPVGLTLCLRAACIDLQGDPANCGGCGHACGINDRCVLGRCTEVPCADPDSRHCDPASTTCSSIVSDPQNCGACGARCLDEERTVASCSGGVCTRRCAPGFASCGTSAPCSVELAFDDDHCGGCDVRCGALGHCIGGVCTSLDARPIAPLSTLILGIQRPRFRWERAPGVDGVRLQLCADRACTRVESTRDLTGDEYRPDVALTPGVHYWRLFARRVGVVSASPSPVWEFVVPVVDTGREVTGFLHDIDGDGVEETLDVGGIRHSAAPGGVQPLPTTPPALAPVWWGGRYVESLWLYFSGDIDGDGFGDLVGSHSWRNNSEFGTNTIPLCTLVRGGAPRFGSVFHDFPVGRGAAATTDYDGTECNFAFDLNGDGHGDITSRAQFSRSGSYDEAILGAQDGWSSWFSVAAGTLVNSYSRMTWGDFNGDGLMELVHLNRDSIDLFFTTVTVWSFRPGTREPATLAFPDCSSGPPPGFLSRMAILDVNGDGFDDLRTNSYVNVLTYLGGPAGFARCLSDPPMP